MKNNKHDNPGPHCCCYKHNNSQAVYCTGLPGAASDISTFTRAEDRKKFMEKYCYPVDVSHRCPKYPVLIRYCGNKSDG